MQPQVKRAILSETSRTLATALAWSSSGLLGVQIPLDSVYKGFSIRFNGVTTTTFSSTPTASPLSTIDNVVSFFEVQIEGNRTVKHRRPHMIQLMNHLFRGNPPVRRASAGAAAAYNNNPTADAGFTYGSTTNITTVLEHLYLPMECIVCKDQPEATWLVTKGKSSAQLNIQCGTVAGLDLTTNCTFSATAFAFEITTIEAQDLMPTEQWDWKQTYNPYVLSTQQTDYIVNLPLGNKLLGLALLVLQNSDGTDGTAANRKKPNNNSVSKVKVRKNGREIYSTSFQSIQDMNRSRKGVNAAFASNVSRFDGYAYLDFLQNGVLGTALDLTRDSETFSAELVITTLASDSTSNIYPIEVDVETNELYRVS